MGGYFCVCTDCKTLTEEQEVLTAEVSHWKAQLNEAVNQAQKDKQVALFLLTFITLYLYILIYHLYLLITSRLQTYPCTLDIFPLDFL